MLALASRNFWFRLLHRGLLGALLCAALSLAHERPRRLVIGHVLLHGHARYGAADHVESQVLQRFEANATLESPAVCSAIRYGPMSSFLPLFLYSLVNQLERVGPTIAWLKDPAGNILSVLEATM
jgi:hypothetical protein